MNFMKFINSDYLKNNPLCGIVTYKDELNLATGACTRRIRKLVLTGEENITKESGNAVWKIPTPGLKLPGTQSIYWLCSHYESVSNSASWATYDYCISWSGTDTYALRIRDKDYAWSATLESFKQYLTDQYAAGTPVTIWYILATPTTETITVPSGLSGTEEGYLNQSGTPTPTNPIYPTANTVEKWFDLKHYIMGTSTDTITTLPAVLYPNDTTATVGLKGNEQHTGTPTPTTPIMPQGTGDKTANLLVTTPYKTGYTIDASGHEAQNSDFNIYNAVASANTIYTVSFNYSEQSPRRTCRVHEYNNGVWIRQATYGGNEEFPKSFTTSATTTELRIQMMNTNSNRMLNTGNQSLPYEEYGYKIPISSANTTTNIYLGEVQTTRAIYKKVLTGEESGYSDWKKSNTYQGSFYAKVLNNMGTPKEVICSHAEYTPTISASSYVYGKCAVDGSNPDRNLNVFIGEASWTVSDFKAYLQQQYANGTPVTIWYVLATETTGIVNEPLQKIGSYADSISGISIPTTDGANALSIGTTVQPSEVTANYHGWHTGAVHERESGSWD